MEIQKDEFMKKIDFINSKKTILILFIIVGSIVFISQNNNISFQTGHHGFLSSHGMAISKNISFEHNLLMFNYMSIEDNKIYYKAYNRFPITIFLIIKLAISIFPNDLAVEILIARYIILIFYLASIIITYKTLNILINSRILSFSVTLLVFSSYYLQYYNDMIFNDYPALFGLLLTFNGIVVYNKDRDRYKQLLIKSIIAVLLGWQVYSLLFTYAFYCFIKNFILDKKVNRVYIKRLVFNNYTKLLFCTIIVGFLILLFQILNEVNVTKNDLLKTPTIVSMQNRLGLNKKFEYKYYKYINHKQTLKIQTSRVIGMVSPFYKNKLFSKIYVIIISIIFIYSLLKYGKQYYQLFELLLLLVIAGILWGFGMNNFTNFHEFQAIYYIGIPIIIYSSIAILIKELFSSHMSLYLLSISLVVFLINTFIYNSIKNTMALKSNIYTYDMQNNNYYIRQLSKICFDGNITKLCGGYHGCEFYLSGNYLEIDKNSSCDFLISKNRKYKDAILLTPNNKKLFLYRVDSN